MKYLLKIYTKYHITISCYFLLSHKVQQVVAHRFVPLSRERERGLLNFVANQVWR